MFERLLRETDWRKERITLFGKTHLVPRLVAWYGDASYKYSGVVHAPKPWTPELLELKAKAEAFAGCTFNSCLLNLYRDGRDGMGWHRDDEPELGPVICSISLGASRVFKIEGKPPMLLKDGDIILLDKTQRHCLPKTKKKVGPRINATFRRVFAKVRP